MEFFIIKNIIRKAASRVVRAVNPSAHRKFKVYVCGQRLLRSQSIKVTKAAVMLDIENIKKQLLAKTITMSDQRGRILTSSNSISAVNSEFVVKNGFNLEKVSGVEEFLSAEVDLKSNEESKHIETVAAPAEEPSLQQPPQDNELNLVKEVGDDKKNDLTELPGIGPGRANKLKNHGIDTFEKLANLEVSALMKILGPPLTTEGAKEIIEAAIEMKE